jgi:hypothetical protein
MPNLSLSPIFILCLLTLSGCATPKYACGVPDGIGCKPLSEVHRMAQDGTLKMRAAPNNREDAQSNKTSNARSRILGSHIGVRPYILHFLHERLISQPE